MELLTDSEAESKRQGRSELIRMAAHAALRDKMWLNEVSDRRVDDVIDEIWSNLADESKIDDGESWQLSLQDDKKKRVGSG
jgi:metal-responsive CopG/Arc/MetJ family transcriptional regulator